MMNGLEIIRLWLSGELRFEDSTIMKKVLDVFG